MPIKPSSMLFNTLKGKRRSLYLKTQWQTLQLLHVLQQTLWLLQPWQALHWTREPAHASINCLGTQEKVTMKASLFNRCGWSRTISRKGGWGITRGSYVISIPDWVQLKKISAITQVGSLCIYSISIIKQFLSNPTGFTFFLIILPFPPGCVCLSERVAVSWPLSCHLKLNHNALQNWKISMSLRKPH